MKQFKPNRKVPGYSRGVVSVTQTSNLQKSPKYCTIKKIKPEMLPYYENPNRQEQQIHKISQTIKKNLKQQQSIIKTHCKSLFMEIKEYYIGIFKQVEKQRNELQLCIESQFNKFIRKLESYWMKLKEMEGQMVKDKKKNFKIIYHLTENFQVPTIVFQQADKKAIDAIIASIHPIVQFSQEHPQQRYQQPQHDIIKSTNNQAQPTSENMIKTVTKIPQNKQFFCEEEFEWGYKFPKAKRYAGINQTIIEQPESKQNSLLIPQIC